MKPYPYWGYLLIRGSILLVILLAALPTHAATADDLATIHKLQTELAALQARLSPPALVLNSTLSLGSHGPDVIALQTYLKTLGFFTYPTITGYFGPVTQTAVAAYQTAHGLEAVGSVGPRTRALLAQPPVIPPVTSSATSLPSLPSQPRYTSPGRHSSPSSPSPDISAPLLQDISSGTPTQTTTTVTWVTDEPATSGIEYGTTTSYTASTSDASLVLSHSLPLAGLTPGTTYHFRINSTDASGNAGVSNDGTFATTATLSYRTDAVALDGTSYGEIAAVAGPASISGYTSSEWFWLPSYPTGFDEPALWSFKRDADLAYGNYIYDDDPPIYLEGGFLNDDDSSYSYQWTESPALGTWHHMIQSYDFSSSTMRAAAYLDGVQMEVELIGPSPATSTFNGYRFQLGRFDTGYGYQDSWVGYMADFWWDPSSVLDENGLISSSTLAKFRNPITGKPEDLGAHGELPTGTRPFFFNHLAPGDPAATFFENKGSDTQDFTVTGIPAVSTSSPTD